MHAEEFPIPTPEEVEAELEYMAWQEVENDRQCYEESCRWLEAEMSAARKHGRTPTPEEVIAELEAA
jgi:hypothetical protein